MRKAYRPEAPQCRLKGATVSMQSSERLAPDANVLRFHFRPWVRRAGISIVVTAAAISAAIVIALAAFPSARYGWIGEPFVWAYIGTLWAGGLKVWTGTRRPIAELAPSTLTLRPLHQFKTRVVEWGAISGTEQMTGGDRLIVYFDTSRGMRFVALNLNLVKGRRDFLLALNARLREMGFVERTVERSRYLSRAT